MLMWVMGLKRFLDLLEKVLVNTYTNQVAGINNRYTDD